MQYNHHVLLGSLLIGFGCHGSDAVEISPTGAPSAAPDAATAPSAAPDAAQPLPAPVVDAAPPPLIDAALPSDATTKSKRLGKHGDVCAVGTRHPRQSDDDPSAKVTPVECGPGLQCCYPCGIQGCDWVCHTQSECNMDRRRP